MQPTDPRVMALLPTESHNAFLAQLEMLLSLAAHCGQQEHDNDTTRTEPDRLLQQFQSLQEQARGISAPATITPASRMELRDALARPEFADYRRQLRQQVLAAIETNGLYLDQLTLWTRLLRTASTVDPRTRRYDATGGLVTTGAFMTSRSTTQEPSGQHVERHHDLSRHTE